MEQSRPIHIGKADVKTLYTYNPTTKLPETVSVNSQTTSYAYDSGNRLKSETINGVHSRTYDYDSYDRPVKVTETITSKSFVSFTAYDAYGRVAKETFPSGYFITNTYDDYGHHTSVIDSKGSKIWEAKEADAFGRLTKYNQGGRTTTMAYDPETGLPSSIQATGIINMSYTYNDKGLLELRNDGKGQKEVFPYDGMNRLNGWTLIRTGAAQQNYSMTYDPQTGGIQNKPNVGYTMTYGGNDGPPRALTSVGGMPQELKAHAPQTIEYNDFNKVTRIAQEDKIYNLTYGTHRQRIKSVLSAAGSTKQTKYYLGTYEEEVDASGNIRKLHYIYGSNTLAAIMEHKSGQENLYYTYTDYQGNLMTVTDAAGKVKESYAYDPWGLRKDPTNWSVSDTRTSFLFSRGYTMHEHLDDFGLINMNSCVKRGQCANLFAAMPSVARVGEANGRVYDPLMAQFLSPDPYIQAPGSWMNYNRYAYCLNNPLMYSDPSGYNWFKDAWNWAWGKLNQFAIWADKNGIPSGGFGVGVQGDTPYYNANFAGLTYDTRYQNQFDPAVNVNRSINEVRLAEGVVNYNPAGQGGNYFEDARVYTLNFGHFKNGAAMTIPGVGIFVGPGDANNIDLLRHEYGHILHYKKWGAKIFWGEIVPASLKSANKANSDWSFNHMDTWTDWSANRLSYQYFNQPTDWSPDYPIWPTTIRPGVMPPFVVGPFDFKYNWLDN